jgi:hypothetical protein
MRTHFILIVTALAFIVAATYFPRDTALPSGVEAAKPLLSSAVNVEVSEPPLREERRDDPAPPEQQRFTLLTEKIASLEARLRDMETTASRQAQTQVVARADKQEESNATGKTKTKKLAEADFAHWMDEVLNTEGLDREATRVTGEHMATSLAEAPGLTLADLRCGQRFCRASFATDSGKPPTLQQLVEATPFMGAGTTIPEPDGSVTLYFAPADQSFSELRKEARAVVLGALPSE